MDELAVIGQQQQSGRVLIQSADRLHALHRRLQAAFAAHLTPQDQQKLQPHVTIQNKVDPAVAQQLLVTLQADFAPFGAVGTGLHLWAYRNGPWESVAELPFGD